MKTLLTLATVFLILTQAYSQTQLKTTTPDKHKLKAGCAPSQFVENTSAKSDFAVSGLINRAQENYEDYLETEVGSILNSMLNSSFRELCPTVKNRKEPHPKLEFQAPQFYLKIENGKWKSGSAKGLNPTPTYIKKSILCFVGGKDEVKNNKVDMIFSIGSFSFCQ